MQGFQCDRPGCLPGHAIGTAIHRLRNGWTNYNKGYAPAKYRVPWGGGGGDQTIGIVDPMRLEPRVRYYPKSPINPYA